MTHAVGVLASNRWNNEHPNGDVPKSDGFGYALCGVSCLLGAVVGTCYGLYSMIATEGNELSLLVGGLVSVAVTLVCAVCCLVKASREGSKSFAASNAGFFQEMDKYNRNKRASLIDQRKT